MDARRSIEYVPLDEVRAADRNPKGHDGAGISRSISEFGFVEPIVVDERTGQLVAGHGRLEQLLELRRKAGKTGRAKGGPPDGVVLDGTQWLVPVIRGWRSADAAHAEAYLLASNRLTEAGGWQGPSLAESLQHLSAIDPQLMRLAGFDDRYLDDLMDRLAGTPEPVAGGDPHSAPAVVEDRPPLSQPGDLYQLGPHRLIVGDSADPAVLARLMDGGRAQALWTDPPYGVDYVGKTSKRLTIVNDADPDAAVKLFAAVLDAIADSRSLSPGAAFYVAHPDGPLSWQFRALLSTRPYRYRQTLIWVKDAMVLGHSDYHYRHEPVAAGSYDLAALFDLIEDEDVRARVAEAFEVSQLADDNHAPIAYGAIEGGGRRGRGGSGWHGSNAETSVVTVPRPKVSKLHPTMKPLDLVAGHLTNSTRRGATVLDTFAGSGTTLIACATLGRLARLAEKDPQYADVICTRWQHVTGQPPTINGQPRTFPTLDPADAP